MRNDRVASVLDYGKITPLIIHTQLHAQDGSIIYIPVHRAGIRAYNHKIVLVQHDIRNMLEQSLQCLVRGNYIIKAHQGNRILYTRIMCVKGNNLRYSHVLQLLQSHCAIEGFSGILTMLTAAVQDRHDHIDTMRLTADSLNRTLQIRKMLVRRHGNLVSKHVITAVVVARIADDINVQSSYGMV